MSKLQPVRGTHDLIGEEAAKHRFIVDTARKVGELYGFEEISTPIFEFTEVFKRTLGETSDVVHKEMYSFEDRGGESITLRPEFTAGIARAFISNGLQQALPLKLFSTGPLFRYERPQKGRQRQFHQVNFEWLGNAEPNADVEVIALANQILNSLGIKNYTLEINSLGDTETRKNYREKLVAYLSKYKNDLSEDSKTRLEQNPLRVLDSKDEGDKKIIKDAPLLTEYLSENSKKFFDNVKAGLDALSIKYKVNPKIVRGLDYYNDVVFEFISASDDLGAQNTILAGGRYDGLIKQMGGPETPAIGFAAGIERLALMASVKISVNRPVALIAMGEKEELEILKIAAEMRNKNISAEVIYGGNLGKKMKKADKVKASHAIILGSDELAKGIVVFKNLETGEQKEIARNNILLEVGKK